MRVLTPGHDLVTDTLIMHGIVRVLAYMGIYDAVVERRGERYIVEFDGWAGKLDKTDLARQILLDAEVYRETRRPVGLLHKINEANINLAVFDNWVSDLSQALLDADLGELSEGHREKFEEGRSRSKKLVTLHITLSPLYGRYRQREYSIEEGIQYKVCNTCFSLANIGFMYGAAALIVRRGADKDVILMSPAPADKIDAMDILLLQRLTETYKTIERVGGMPLLAAPLYWLSTGETLYVTDADLELVVWRVAKSGNFQRALDAATLNLRRLMEFVADVKYVLDGWPHAAGRLVTEAPEVLALLTEYVLYGGDLYAVARSLAASCGGKPCVDEASLLVKILAKLW